MVFRTEQAARRNSATPEYLMTCDFLFMGLFGLDGTFGLMRTVAETFFSTFSVTRVWLSSMLFITSNATFGESAVTLIETKLV